MVFSVITNTISARDVDAATNEHSGIKNVVSSSTLSITQKISFEIPKADAIPDTMDILSWLGYIDEDARWYSLAAQRTQCAKTVVAQQAAQRRIPPPSGAPPTIPLPSPLTSLPSFSSVPRRAPAPPPVDVERAPEVKPLKTSIVPEVKGLKMKKIMSTVTRPFQFRERAQEKMAALTVSQLLNVRADHS